MNFKRGMTLAETLLVFIIVGIIASFTLSSLKPWEKQYKDAYMSIYNALKLSLYNGMVDKNEFPRKVSDLCDALVSYMNTGSESISCSSITSKGSNPTDEQLTAASSVILSNGMRMWFGGQNQYNCPDDSTKKCEYYTDDTSGADYFYVYVDLNGDNKPNTSAYSPKKLADIVGFALTDKYTVIPLGYPKIDMRYLQANVVYPPVNDDSSETVSEPMPFMKAQAMAFGYDGTAGNVRSASDPLTYVGTLNSPKEFGTGNFALNMSRTDISALKSAVEVDTIESQCAQTGDYSGATEPICRVEIFNYH